jgi:hypothetical protein
MLGVAMIALAGCGPDAPSAHPFPSSSVDVSAAWLDVENCMRTNGYPNFPRPVVNEKGGWRLPDSPDVPRSGTTTPCDDLVRKAKQGAVAANAVSGGDGETPRVAKFMRENGAPKLPDPDSDGNFNIPEALRQDPARDTAAQAWKQYAPPPRPK